VACSIAIITFFAPATRSIAPPVLFTISWGEDPSDVGDS
jgi:hypothetical protein